MKVVLGTQSGPFVRSDTSNGGYPEVQGVVRTGGNCADVVSKGRKHEAKHGHGQHAMLHASSSCLWS